MEKKFNKEETLGQRIRAQRIRMGLTQEELAEKMCVPKSTLSAYENDKVDIKSSVILELAWHLNTSPNYLLGYEDPPAEEDALVKAVSSIIKKIEDGRVRDLLVAQMKVAANMYS